MYMVVFFSVPGAPVRGALIKQAERKDGKWKEEIYWLLATQGLANQL
jgi:hypothetical protein